MIIAIANQKGGQGKSTTAQAIATGATHKGKKCLSVDLDAQGNLSFSMGGDMAAAGTYELLTGAADPGQIIQHTQQGDIITASSGLAAADTILTGDDRVNALKNALQPIKDKYDVIVVDCPPTLNTLLLNALAAADKVIIPMTADAYSLQGLYQLAQTIQAAQQINPGLEIGGALFVKHHTRTILNRDLSQVIRAKCSEIGIPLYKTYIREGVAIREAQTLRKSIFDYAPKSKPAKDYLQFIEEIGL